MRPLRETTLRARALRRLACRAPCIAATARCPAQARGGGWLVLRDGVQRRQRGRRGGRSSHCSKPPPPRRPRRCRPYAPGRLCPSQSGEGVRSVVSVSRLFFDAFFRNSASSALDFTKSAERSPMQVTFSGYFCWFQQKTDLFARIFLNMWETREGRTWCWKLLINHIIKSEGAVKQQSVGAKSKSWQADRVAGRDGERTPARRDEQGRRGARPQRRAGGAAAAAGL